MLNSVDNKAIINYSGLLKSATGSFARTNYRIGIERVAVGSSGTKRRWSSNELFVKGHEPQVVMEVMCKKYLQ